MEEAEEEEEQATGCLLLCGIREGFIQLFYLHSLLVQEISLKVR